jgi:hypothetical protein
MNAAEAKAQAISNESKRIKTELAMVREKIQEQVDAGYFCVRIEPSGFIHPGVWEILKAEGYAVESSQKIMQRYNYHLIEW